MHQLAILSPGWAVFFHSASDEVHHSLVLFAIDLLVYFGFVLSCFCLGPDLTHSYSTHFPTHIILYQPLVPY
jgi:hypothetical protein